MGLRLPTSRQLYKVTYTSLQIGLILLASVVGGVRLFPMLYLIVVIRSCFIFEQLGRLIVTGIAFALFLVSVKYRVETLNLSAFPAVQQGLGFILFGSALLFGMVLAFLLLLVNAVLSENHAREKLAIAHEQLRHYALRIEDIATLQERNRIARDIHDSLGHFLTALNLQLETALKLWQSNPAKAEKFLAEAKRLAATALQEVRQSVSALRSDPLQGQSLKEAITSLTEEFHRTTGILPDCSIQLESPLPADVTTTIYRIVQEALTNICKYAAATEVNIKIQATTSQLCLTVQDNGVGFIVDSNTTGFGLQGMRERTLALRGQFEIDSALASGCQITVNIPI
jgi:signal transduction histidine kinase